MIQSRQKTDFPKNGDAPRAGRRRLYLCLFVAIGGIVISLLLARLLRDHEQQLIAVQFQHDGMRRIEAIQNAATDRLNVVDIIEAFYSGSRLVERDEFHTFAKPLLARFQGVTAIGWVPLITQDERDEHERATEKDGFPNYRINEQKNGRIVNATERDYYLPIIFIEPFDKNSTRLGFDIRSDSACFSAVKKAMDTGMPAAVVCTSDGSSKTDGRLLYVVAPVYKKGENAFHPADRSVFEGFVFAAFDISAIIEESLKQFAPIGIDICIRDPNRGDEPPICFRPSPMRDDISKEADGAVDSEEGLPNAPVLKSVLIVANRRGEITCVPLKCYLSRQRSWQPTVVLITGLVVTCLFVGFVYLLTEGTSRVKRLVAQRTRELRASEQRFRRLVDNAGDAIFLHDETGLIVDTNNRASESLGYSREEILAMYVSDIDVNVEPGSHLRSWNLTENEYPITLEGVHRRKDGTTFPVELRLVPLTVNNRRLMLGLARDITDRKKAEQELLEERHLLRELLDLQEQDRKLISYEIHDGLAQLLAGAQMQFQTVGHLLESNPEAAKKSFDNAFQVLGEALAETRRLIGGLRPPVLDELGIIAAIEEMIAHYGSKGPEIEFTHNVMLKRFAPPLESAIFRTIQESLTNACRYSQSEKVRVEIGLSSDSVTIDVRDWGVGFDPDEVPTDHFGLRGIRERARLLRGSAEIESSPGQGAHIHVVLPLSLVFEKDASAEDSA